MVTWQSKQDFHTPNGVQDAAIMKVVSQRMVDEAFYEWAKVTDLASVPADAEGQANKIKEIANTLSKAVLDNIQKEGKALGAAAAAN